MRGETETKEIIAGGFARQALLVEITLRPAGGLTDEELLGRLKWIQTEVQVARVAKKLAETRQAVAEVR